MHKEGFFRKTTCGTIVLRCHQSVGIHNAVDCIETHQRVFKHFQEGNGWPMGKPIENEPVTIWSAFRAADTKR